MIEELVCDFEVVSFLHQIFRKTIEQPQALVGLNGGRGKKDQYRYEAGAFGHKWEEGLNTNCSMTRLGQRALQKFGNSYARRLSI